MTSRSTALPARGRDRATLPDWHGSAPRGRKIRTTWAVSAALLGLIATIVGIATALAGVWLVFRGLPRRSRWSWEGTRGWPTSRAG